MSQKVKNLLRQLKIEFYNSTMTYPQCNGQSEATNKTITNGIKKRFEKAKGKWVEELPNILWAYRTTPWKAMNKTPYALTFRFKAVILLEVDLLAILTETYKASHNLMDKLRENALIRMTDYQKQLAKTYNQKVQYRQF